MRQPQRRIAFMLASTNHGSDDPEPIRLRNDEAGKRYGAGMSCC